jgi:hypothetical protein
VPLFHKLDAAELSARLDARRFWRKASSGSILLSEFQVRANLRFKVLVQPPLPKRRPHGLHRSPE